MTVTMSERIDIRLSTDDDRERIRTLAELDGKHPPHGDVLLAELDGRLVAAIGMDGAVIADPFERTAGVVRALRAQVSGQRDGRPRRRRWLARLLPA
jgi:hypothetical protein